MTLMTAWRSPVRGRPRLPFLTLGSKDGGQLTKALPLHEETLAKTKAQLGPDHPDMLGSMNNLAVAYYAARQLNRALPLFEAAARGIEKRRFQHEHARLILANTIRAYEQAKQFAKAQKWRQKWLAHVKAAAGPESPAYADELAELGLSLLQQSKGTKAEPVLRECLTIHEKKLPDSWATFHAQSLLGGALLGQKKYKEAEPLLLQGYEGMERRQGQMPAAARPRLREALERLIELYEATAQAEQAARWRQELEGVQGGQDKEGK
jgi:tetratricopeptide (TPR) repeat protein